jgi:AhpC/TSA family
MDPSPGERFPDLDLPDHTGRSRRLSELAGGDPLVLITSRGWCPKEQRYLREPVRMQGGFEVAYTRIVVISVDQPEVQAALRAGLGVRSTDASDVALLGRLQRLLVLGPRHHGGAASRHALDQPGYSRRVGGAGGVSRGELGFAHVVFDGERLSADPHSRGRRLRLDARRLRGGRVAGAYAHVCATTDPDAVLRFDEPEVQQVRRDALEHWIPLLGAELVCFSTFSLAASLCGAGGAGDRALCRSALAGGVASEPPRG